MPVIRIAAAWLIAGVIAVAQAPPDAGEIERQARALDAKLMAPCCFTQQVSVHQSAAADEVRREVRARLAGGERPEAIVEAYVARYGKRILAEPPAAGFDRTLYVAPFVLLLGTLTLVAAVIRRYSRRPAEPSAAPGGEEISAEDRTQLEDELRELD